MKLWVMVLLAVLIFDLGFVLGACWCAFWSDMPTTKHKPIDDSLEADSAEYLSKAGM